MPATPPINAPATAPLLPLINAPAPAPIRAPPAAVFSVDVQAPNPKATSATAKILIMVTILIWRNPIRLCQLK